jgi:nucleoside-diphosphate-sugar epimerase
MNEMDGRRTLDVFKDTGCRIVAVSSADVYRAYDRYRRADPGVPDPTPLTEDSPLRDRLFPYRDQAKSPDDFLYNYDKILMERAIMSDPKVKATVIRLPMVYGPGDYQHRPFEYLKRMDDGRPAILISERSAVWRGLRGYVENVAEAIVRCTIDPRAPGRIYHIADPEALTELEWICNIAKAAGWHGKIITLPDLEMPVHLRNEADLSQDWSMDSSRIRDELDYREVVVMEEAMRRTVEWERANPPKTVDPSGYNYAAEDQAVGHHSEKSV